MAEVNSPVHMPKRFSTFRVSTVCILAASTVKTGAARREGIAARVATRSDENRASRNVDGCVMSKGSSVGVEAKRPGRDRESENGRRQGLDASCHRLLLRTLAWTRCIECNEECSRAERS